MLASPAKEQSAYTAAAAHISSYLFVLMLNGKFGYAGIQHRNLVDSVFCASFFFCVLDCCLSVCRLMCVCACLLVLFAYFLGINSCCVFFFFPCRFVVVLLLLFGSLCVLFRFCFPFFFFFFSPPFYLFSNVTGSSLFPPWNVTSSEEAPV